MILAFDVGGTFIKWGVMDELRILQKGKVKTPSESFEEFIDVIDKVVCKIGYSELEGLAFSMPGTIDKKNGIIIQGGSLRYNNKRYFKKEMNEYFKLPISLENDARCAAITEVNLGNLKGVKNGIVLVVGTGIGGALIKNGEVHLGSHGYSGEFSLILTNDFKKYGMNAFLGNQTGMKAFIQEVRKEFNDYSITGESFIKMIKNDNKKAVILFNKYASIFAQQLFNLQMIFDPERIVIGGGISEESLYINFIKTKFEEIFSSLPINIRHADIKPCKYANDSNLMGAYLNFKLELFDR